MQIDDAQNLLNRLITEKGLKLEDITLNDGLCIFNTYYHDYRFENCNLEEDGDMLLYEWGTYSWNDNLFQISLGRQFISNFADGDEAFKQLHLIFFYPEGTFNKDLSGNKWFSNPNNTDEIISFVSNQDIFKSLLDSKPVKVEIDFDDI